MTLEVATQLLGLVLLLLPLLAIRLNLAGNVERRSSLLPSAGGAKRWRLEIYSTSDDAVRALADPAEVPFPVNAVRSSKSDPSGISADRRWTIPRIELDVEVSEPFAADALNGLLGTDHEVRLVTGNEAVIDARSTRIRIRALRFT